MEEETERTVEVPTGVKYVVVSGTFHSRRQLWGVTSHPQTLLSLLCTSESRLNLVSS